MLELVVLVVVLVLPPGSPVTPPVPGARGRLGLPVVLPGQAEAGGCRVGVSPTPASPALPWGTGGGGGGGGRGGLGPGAGHHLRSAPALQTARPQSGAGAGLTGALLQPGPLSLLPGLRVLLQRLELGQRNDVAAPGLVPNCLLAACIVVIEPEHQ